MRTHVRLALMLLFLFALTSAVKADVVFDNFGSGLSFPDNGRILEGPLVVDIADIDQAASFTTGSQGVDITDVKLGISVDSPASTPFDGRGPINILVASDAGGLPGATLSTTTLNVNTFGSQVVDAPIAGLVKLEPNTQYWIIAEPQGKFDGSWEFNPTSDFGPTAGRSNGGAWSLQSASDPRLVFEVQARVVPEPSSLVLLASGLLLAAWKCKRRR